MIRGIGQFLHDHWMDCVLLLPGIALLIFVHECSHALAAVVQGGDVTEFVCFPSAHEMGHIRFHGLPASASLGAFVVSVAPYGVWCGSCLVAFAISRRQAALNFVASSTVFVWMFLLPFADITNTVLSYYSGNTTNDFRIALGWPPSVSVSIVFVTVAVGLACLGFPTQQRLYRDRAVGGTCYSVLGLGSFLLLVGLKVWRLCVMTNN